MAARILDGLSFDDVLLVPRRSTISSRFSGGISLATDLVPGISLRCPIISANMDTTTGYLLANAMAEAGALGIIHRFLTVEEHLQELLNTFHEEFPAILCIGVGKEQFEERFLRIVEHKDPKIRLGAVLIDIAHGHSDAMFRQIERVKSYAPQLPIIAGNVACVTPDVPVLTRDLRWLPAGKLTVGDSIMGFEEHPIHGRRKWKEARITSTGRKSLPCYEVLLDTGEKYTVTKEHCWLVWDSYRNNKTWLPTDWMYRHWKQGRFGACRLVRPWRNTRQNYRTGYLAAAFDGEGCLTMRNRNFSIVFVQNQNAMLERVKQLLTEFDFDFYEAPKPPSCRYVEIRGGFSEKLRFLAQIRPARLLDKWFATDISILTTKITSSADRAEIISILPCGDKEVVTLSSSSETYVANGYGMHNTYEGAYDLINAGVNSIKCGVGPGSVCSTRIHTGNGVPQLTAIMECRRAIDDRVDRNQFVSLIGDGGIRFAGDIVKAIAGGADAVMIGNLFAGTTEAIGETVSTKHGLVKVYRGMASREAQKSWKGYATSIEGEMMNVPYKGSAMSVLDGLISGLLSGMSYQNARNIKELQENAVFIRQTAAGYRESQPHALLKE